LEGAKEGGVGGFFKGVGVGLLGVVTKPVVGIIDMTSSLSEGIRGSADADLSQTVTQIRLPRLIPYNGRLASYDSREAFGQSILVSALGSHPIISGSERYVAHLNIVRERALLVMTSRRLLVLHVDRLVLLWSSELSLVTRLESVDDTLLIHYHDDEEQAGTEQGEQIKVVAGIDTPSQQWFVSLFDAFVKAATAP